MDNGFINCVAAPLLMNVIAGKWDERKRSMTTPEGDAFKE